MNNPVVLITGATGFLGSHLIRQLINRHYAVHALVHHSLDEGALIHPLIQYSVFNLNCIDEQQARELIARVSPIALIHCAAITDVAYCERRPSQAYVVNTAATRLLARACALHDVHYTFISSDLVFDGCQVPQYHYTEEDQVHPLTFYGVSKWQGELAVQEECGTHSSWTICRPSNIYGAVGLHQRDEAMAMLVALQQKKMVYALYDQVFSPTWIEELASMIVELTLHRDQGIYHTSGSSVVDQYTFAQCLASIHGYSSELIVPILSRSVTQAIVRPRYAGLNIEKVHQALGYLPLTLEQGMSSWLARLQHEQ